MKAVDAVRNDGLKGTFNFENELHQASIEGCRVLMETILCQENLSIPEDYKKEGEYDAGKRLKTIRLLSGDIQVKRTCYYNKEEKAGRYPFDEALGLINGSTPALVEKATRLAAKDPYAEASDTFEVNLRRRMTPDILMTFPAALGGRAREFLASRESPDKRTPECVCVLGDGTGVPMRREELKGVKGKQQDGTAKTREIKVGAIFSMTPNLDPDEKPVRNPDTTTYVATSERKDAFGKLLRGEYDRRFCAMPKTTLFIGDGAPWLWSIRRIYFPFAVEILDFYHAVEHLEDILKILRYEKKERKKLFEKWKRWLLAGKVTALIDDATNRLGEHKDASKVTAYFRNNVDRMKYNEYRAKGWFIGSGVVESACRTVVGARFKQSGMFWSKKGLDALLPFRVALKSERYKELWRWLIKDTPQLAVI